MTWTDVHYRGGRLAPRRKIHLEDTERNGARQGPVVADHSRSMTFYNRTHVGDATGQGPGRVFRPQAQEKTHYNDFPKRYSDVTRQNTGHDYKRNDAYSYGAKHGHASPKSYHDINYNYPSEDTNTVDYESRWLKDNKQKNRSRQMSDHKKTITYDNDYERPRVRFDDYKHANGYQYTSRMHPVSKDRYTQPNPDRKDANHGYQNRNTWRTSQYQHGYARSDSEDYMDGGRHAQDRPHRPFHSENKQNANQNILNKQNANRNLLNKQTQHTRGEGDVRPATRGNKTAATPELHNMAKLISKLIKLTHHLQNITAEGNKPTAFSKLETHLSTVIKAAYPTENLELLLSGNAKNWMHTTNLILQEHYTEVIQEVMGELSTVITPQWNTALQIGKRWATYSLGERLKDSTVTQVEAMLIAEFPTVSEATGEMPVPTRERRVSVGVQTSFLGTAGDWSYEREYPPIPQTQKKTPTAGTRPKQPTAIQPKPQRSRRENSDAQTTVAAEIQMSPDQEDFRETIHMAQGDKLPVPIEPLVCLLEPTLQMVSPTRGPHTEAIFSLPRGTSTPVNTSLDLEEIFNNNSHSSQPSLEDQDSSFEIPDTPLTPFNTSEEEEEASISPFQRPTEGPENLNRDNGAQDNTLIPPLSPTLTPMTKHPPRRPSPFPLTATPPVYKPHRNPNTTRKLIDWRLLISKECVIIGDSNLANIPEFHFQNLQIESFPGANFWHAEQLMTKATIRTRVTKIVLAFGINNRDQKFRETASKQLQRAIKAARDKCPTAEVWVPVINFSEDLPIQQQTTLQNLNQHIKKTVTHIPPLPKCDFQVGQDHIHWTLKTAQAMLKHWVHHLNC